MTNDIPLPRNVAGSYRSFMYDTFQTLRAAGTEARRGWDKVGDGSDRDFFEGGRAFAYYEVMTTILEN